MKVHCDEGVATHIGPESCAGAREGIREALTGECTGQPSSRERNNPRALTQSSTRKATRTGAQFASAPDGPAWSETLACADALCTGTGRSHVRPFGMHRRSAWGRRGAVAHDART